MIAHIKIGRIPVHVFTEETLHIEIDQVIKDSSKKTFLNTNAHLVQLANSTEQWLINYFSEQVDYVVCDGASIQLGAKYTNQVVPEKITYNIWFWNFAKFCSENNHSIFLLGGQDGVAQKAVQRLIDKNPELKIYYHHGYFNKKSGSKENDEVIKMINKIKPNILVVCFGMPIQEKYIKDNYDLLNVNVFLSGGGALDFISGNVKTAPSFISKIYMEWFYRLCLDPKRLWKRYLIGNFMYIYYVLKYRKNKI
ncbi:MAG: WecB/TagA/CpsF family glycosyltransferase [Bacteroidia bacterium]|nr:WecB/TagA/CpsF family glycosyltransferase [Bacteroidia bacterium]